MRSCFGWSNGHDDSCSLFESFRRAFPAPAIIDELGGIGQQLRTPVLNISFLIRKVEEELWMRVGIVELRHYNLLRPLFGCVVRNERSVMRKYCRCGSEYPRD